MHPIYSAYLRHNLSSVAAMSALLLAGIAAMIWKLPLLMFGDDTAIMYIIPAAVVTLSSADMLRKRIFSGRKKLRKFLSTITPEQNARVLAEFRYNQSGEVLAGDFLILLFRQFEFIKADTLKITATDSRASVSGVDYSGRSDEWYLDDEEVIQKLRLLLREKRRCVVCEGERR